MATTTKTQGSIAAQEGEALLWLVRHTIAQALGVPIPPQPAGFKELLDGQSLRARQGTFVTLERQGELRGCIGNLVSDDSIVEGVRRNALSAAFHDTRFRPLAADEYAEITVSVSVLTQPSPLAYADGDDLITRLRPGIDGVILRQGSYGATFLPQVWEQLPDPAEFLGHLCRKAMLPASAWRSGDLEVSIYQVQYFSEKQG
ncbi:MAG: AmmeMemoRadiSam system protein A [Thermodesulfobacteriota bacterium]